MKYKLKLPLPGVPAGMIFEPVFEGALTTLITGQKICVEYEPENYPDFFEPVEESWRPKPGDLCFYVASTGEQGETTFNPASGADMIRQEFGNHFKTREQYLEASKRVKEVLLQYHKELNQ